MGSDFASIVASLSSVATLTLLVGVGTLIKGVIEFTKQNKLKRFEKYVELSGTWSADKNIELIVELLDDDPHHKLREIPFIKKEAFLGFYEEIALMVESKLLRERIAYYMFGYYTICCIESEDFWAGLDKNAPYWSLFRRFAARMKAIDQTARSNSNYKNINSWKFRI